MENFTPTARTQVRRLPKRGAYDRDTVHRILDEALVCHVGFVADGQPFVIPTGFGRKDDTLYIHGSAASRMLGEISKGVPVCVTVTLIDGLVLARSAFHHSVNYRSVIILGKAREVEAENEKMEALRIFTEHMVPGRWDAIRQPTPQELKATSVLSLDLVEVSAKIRTGNPVDDDADYALPIWAGVLPLKLSPAPPVADAKLMSGINAPDHVARYHR
ncbi:MAG TPA: pyridoxamine 5'-phosphate oxidase family protein [Candidatus Acidoferrales bacterium]|nr:pyridoxamine 5'-phosphate oxidase family protein [Candidatus Acidoferrales bacterium]